jgi:KUP system potassium uptake protein
MTERRRTSRRPTHNRVLHECVVLLTIVTEEVPHVSEKERVEVQPIDERFHRILVHYGYMEEPDVPAALRRLSTPGFLCDLGKASYFLGKESILPAENRPGMALWREKLFALMTRNAFSAMRTFGLPPEQSIEIRGQIEI